MKNPPLLGTWIAVAITASVCTSVGRARADGPATLSRDACIDANAKAQELRRDGKLYEARAALDACVNRACPALVRDDCTRRLDELERAQPTIVFSVKDAAGASVSAVRVSVDGRKLADRLEGKALPVDPGTHTFSFEWAGQRPLTRQLVVLESEKGRLEVIETAAPAAPTASSGASTKVFTSASAFETGVPVRDRDGQSGASQRLWGFVLGGVGIAGIAGGAVLGLMALGASNDSKNECPVSDCPNRQAAQSDHDKAVTFSTVSTVAVIGGGALAAVGATLVLTAPHDGRTALRLSSSVGPSVANLALQGAF